MTCSILEWMNNPPAGTALVDVTTERSWTYGELAADVRRTASLIASRRKTLVACLCRPDAESVIGYLAALSAGHAVMLLDADANADAAESLLDRYQPEYVLCAGHCGRRCSPEAGTLHDDLAVVLCSSGSTGSPKLVRLSARNLGANAQQIVEFLEIDDRERAVQSLPIHYSYGLSVLNSHLVSGAMVVLPGASLVQPDFWEAMRRYECTSFAGVPYAYTILDKIGFERFELPALRTLTQAGGGMAPRMVARFGRTMRDRGGRLVVMYGQTEATARIAYLPPDSVLQKPHSIGIPIPGGRLSLADDCELIYEGPNVMLGYASQRADLALGDINRGVLATGDLGRVDEDGFFRITGRKTRAVKLCGQRINLDELEALLNGETRVAALGTGQRLVIVREAGGRPRAAQELARRVAGHIRVPTHFLDIREVDRIPVTWTGKTDYPRIARELSLDD